MANLLFVIVPSVPIFDCFELQSFDGVSGCGQWQNSIGVPAVKKVRFKDNKKIIILFGDDFLTPKTYLTN